MILSNFKKILIGGVEQKQLFINGVQVWKSGYKNWVRYSINADGTIYNNGLGYKNGYRVRSGGAEGAAAAASCTGFIPAIGGDVVRLSGYDVTSIEAAANAINVFDSGFNNLGQTVANSPNYGYGIMQTTWTDYNWGKSKGVKEESPGVYAWTIPPDASIKYIRVSGYTGGDGSKMIVTINEDIA